MNTIELAAYCNRHGIEDCGECPVCSTCRVEYADIRNSCFGCFTKSMRSAKEMKKKNGF